MNLKIKLGEGAISPVYSSAGAGGFDFFASLLTAPVQLSSVSPTATVDTGVYVEIPSGWSLLVLSRSGQGFTNDVRLGNCVGLIDSDYRGSIKVKLRWDLPSQATPYSINPGDRIAQGILIHTPQVSFTFAESLSQTDRGEGGLGSTGK